MKSAFSAVSAWPPLLPMSAPLSTAADSNKVRVFPSISFSSAVLSASRPEFPRAILACVVCEINSICLGYLSSCRFSVLAMADTPLDRTAGTRRIQARAGTNLGGASAHNRRVVFEALRVNGALSRAELARATQLTAQTVSNIIEEFERDGLAVPEQPIRGARGQPATPYRILPGGAYAIGVQLDRHQ